MRSRTFRIICLLASLGIAIPVLAAQRGSDPLTGAWTGDWGPNAGDRNTVSVDLKWDGKALTGVVHSINYQRADVTLQKSTFNPASGAVHMETDAQNPRGGAPIHYVIDGKLANGSMTGSWSRHMTSCLAPPEGSSPRSRTSSSRSVRLPLKRCTRRGRPYQ